MGNCICGKKPKIAPSRPIVISINGGPGAGVRTHIKKIIPKYKLKLLSMSELQQKAVSKKTKLGQDITENKNYGKPIDGSINIPQLIESFQEPPFRNTGFVLERFPQFEHETDNCREDLIKNINMIHIYIKVHPDIMMVRALSKTVKIEPTTTEYVSQEKVQEERISDFVTKTMPILEHKQTFGKIYSIQGENSIDNVYNEICKIIDENV